MSALLQANQATLLIVDMQGRLMPAIHDGQAVLAAAHKLAQAARLLDVPVVATEHHARMLGVTVAPLDTQIQARFPKMHFSATREPGFTAWLPPARASRPITRRPCAARAAPAPKSSPPRWRFSNGWKLANIPSFATCYVWSNERAFRQQPACIRAGLPTH